MTVSIQHPHLRTSFVLSLVLVLLSFSRCSKDDSNSDPTPNPNPTPTTNTVPSVTTAMPNGTGLFTAICGGAIVSDGGNTITESGVCLNKVRASVNDNLTTGDLIFHGSKSSGSFTFNISSLERNTKYYVCAYAINSIGKGFGTIDSFTTLQGYQPGDTFGTGIVITVDGTNQHGMMVSQSDLSTGIQWYNGSMIDIPGAKSRAVGTGLANTNAIIAAQGSGSYAASICKNYSGGGFHDWYLPSRDELEEYLTSSYSNLMYTNYYSYWSSTQDSSQLNMAWYIFTRRPEGFVNWQDKNYKSNLYSVRAFRNF